MRKVCVTITARPTYSRIKSALVALRARSDVSLQVVAGASALVTRFGRVVDQMARELEPMRRVFMEKHQRRAAVV